MLSATAMASDTDADAMQRARAAGEIQPLGKLLGLVQSQCQGQFVAVELERSNGRWVYEITLLGPHGDVAELEYGADDFALLEAEGRQLQALGCVPPETPH